MNKVIYYNVSILVQNNFQARSAILCIFSPGPARREEARQ